MSMAISVQAPASVEYRVKVFNGKLDQTCRVLGVIDMVYQAGDRFNQAFTGDVEILYDNGNGQTWDEIARRVSQNGSGEFVFEIHIDSLKQFKESLDTHVQLFGAIFRGMAWIDRKDAIGNLTRMRMSSVYETSVAAPLHIVLVVYESARNSDWQRATKSRKKSWANAIGDALNRKTTKGARITIVESKGLSQHKPCKRKRVPKKSFHNRELVSKHEHIGRN